MTQASPSNKLLSLTAKSVGQSKLLDSVREEIRVRHYSIRTEHTYVDWIYRYIIFNNKRHPADMGEAEISRFLSYLATRCNVAASTQHVKGFA